MGTQQDNTVFGAVRMGYVVIASKRLEQWQRFLVDAVGMHLSIAAQDLLAFRMDKHARRLIVERGDDEDVHTIGWQVDNKEVLDLILRRLAVRGVTTQIIEGAQAADRGVESLHRFQGPKGLTIELFTSALMDDTPLTMQTSGFHLGNAGLGHVSMMSREPERSVAFWQELFDARLSDQIIIPVGSKTAMEVSFLRVNERHHSIALVAAPGGSFDMFRTRVQHLNLEVKTLEDLSAAFTRCQQLGCRLTRNIGQHPNDKELSFYVESPSGFELELGWDALAVDEQTWESGRTYAQMSTWGHDIPGLFATELNFSHVVNSLRSLTKKEHLPW